MMTSCTLYVIFFRLLLLIATGLEGLYIASFSSPAFGTKIACSLQEKFYQ
jgi:hypothetical protein